MPDLVLRDIHEPPPPGWWPPAPGWWWLAAAVVAIVVLVGAVAVRRRHRRRAWARLFDGTVEQATDDPGRIAAMSALLRRASRQVRPDADRLQGTAWLTFLDAGDAARGFVDGPGAALLEAPFRRDADDVDIAALQALARARFVSLMGQGR